VRLEFELWLNFKEFASFSKANRSCALSSWRLLPSTLHLLLFEFLFTDGDVPVAGSFIELPAAPLAKYPVIFLLVLLLLLLHLSATATFRVAATSVTYVLRHRCTHTSAQLHALQLPLRDLAGLFRLLLLLFLLLNLSLFF
jgi:hypothetical protein